MAADFPYAVEKSTAICYCATFTPGFAFNCFETSDYSMLSLAIKYV
jgi:hypothetical protein